MARTAWWEIATPDKDIREEFLDERVLAADLGGCARTPSWKRLLPRLILTNPKGKGKAVQIIKNRIEPLMVLQNPGCQITASERGL